MKSPRVALASNMGDGSKTSPSCQSTPLKHNSIPPSGAVIAAKGIDLPCRSGFLDGKPHDHASVCFPPTSISIPISKAMVTSWNVES